MRILFMGTSPFACHPLEQVVEAGHPVACVVTQPDRPQGRGRQCQPSPVKQMAMRLSLPVFQPEDVNAPESRRFLKSLEPEAIVVAAFGQRLGRTLLALPRLGAFNLHASLLPKYRGAAPIARAIADGATETGVTLIRMAPEIDTGNILLQERVSIGPEETAPELEERLGRLAGRMIVQALARLAVGPLPEIAQDHSQATPAPRLVKADGAVNWQRSAHQIACQVRAMQPWPLAFTYWYPRAGGPGQRLILWRARPVMAGAETAGAAPGTILSVHGGQVVVQTGSGALAIVELQPAGGRRLDAAAFARGRPIAPGDSLGPGPDG